MKTNLFSSKLVTRVEYLTHLELNIRYSCKGLPSVTKIFAESNKAQTAWFEVQMRNKNSAIYKATVQGRRAHAALETGTIKDKLTQAVVDKFSSQILVDIDEVWGQEQWLYHPDRYTGKFDGCGVYKGQVTLFDYKKTNKQKTPKQMENYFVQLMAYKQAHEFLYDIKIESVAVFNVFGQDPAEVGCKVVTLDEAQMKGALDRFTNSLTNFNNPQGAAQ
jgi:hypothetical protein